jgi:hypothetical protein
LSRERSESRMYICVLVLCFGMTLQAVHTSWTADPLHLTWEGSTLPAGLLTSYYYIHSCFDWSWSTVGRWVCCSLTCPPGCFPNLVTSCLRQLQNLHWAFVLCAPPKWLKGLWGGGGCIPAALCWHSTVPRTALRHLRRDATPIRRHMTPTDENPHSTQYHKRNAFKEPIVPG